MNDWIKVYITENPYEAEIIKQALEENGIPAVVLNKQDSSYKSFGVLTVLVHPDNFDKATAYISEINIE
ncbi:putative signal transducing protein [Pedobacter metabolipauper]|uniref:Putative signal transducing protein n=1 Tax=Pedobacter metabolipauper TaxID=425513 RepID=A0A4R6SW04_9SPHI|nr:DUF2007 domain-containing protein [Pedobacter metabolipauper]TDQ09556.1 putative signal transducing protein [Pedobacter metabolipauper]